MRTLPACSATVDKHLRGSNHATAHVEPRSGGTRDDRGSVPMNDQTSSAGGSGQGVGARLLRKEDDRLMRGRGQFVADIRLAGHAGRRVRPQPARACAPPRHLGPDRPARRGVHRGRPDGRQADPRGIGAAAASRCRSSRCSPPRRCATSASWSPCASPRPAPKPRTSPQTVALDLDELPAVHDMLQAREAGRRAGARALGRQRLPRDVRRRRHRQGVRRADQGHARDPHRAAMHGADRRPRRGRLLGSPASSS